MQRDLYYTGMEEDACVRFQKWRPMGAGEDCMYMRCRKFYLCRRNVGPIL